MQPTAGGTTTATSGETFVVTDPNTGATAPTTITAPVTGSFTVAVGTVSSNVVVNGDGTAGVTIGNATDAGGGKLNAAGSSFQIADSYKGTVVANLSGAIVDGTKVDTSTDTGAGSIAANLPGGTSSTGFAAATEIDYYVNTGTAADEVSGSKGNDLSASALATTPSTPVLATTLSARALEMTPAAWALVKTSFISRLTSYRAPKRRQSRTSMPTATTRSRSIRTSRV